MVAMYSVSRTRLGSFFACSKKTSGGGQSDSTIAVIVGLSALALMPALDFGFSAFSFTQRNMTEQNEQCKQNNWIEQVSNSGAPAENCWRCVLVPFRE